MIMVMRVSSLRRRVCCDLSNVFCVWSCDFRKLLTIPMYNEEMMEIGRRNVTTNRNQEYANEYFLSGHFSEHTCPPSTVSSICKTIMAGITTMIEIMMFTAEKTYTFLPEPSIKNGFTIPLNLSAEIIRMNPNAMVAVELIIDVRNLHMLTLYIQSQVHDLGNDDIICSTQKIKSVKASMAIIFLHGVFFLVLLLL